MSSLKILGLTIAMMAGFVPCGAVTSFEADPKACMSLAKVAEYAATRHALGYSWEAEAPQIKVGMEAAMKEGSLLIQDDEDLEAVMAILELIYQQPNIEPSRVRFIILEMCDPKHVARDPDGRKRVSPL